MLKKIARALGEKSFNRKARRWLTEKYGDVFTWRAALRLEGAADEHIFSAMAKDMSVVCEVKYFAPDCAELTEEERVQLAVAAFGMAAFPAATEKLLIVPKLKSGAVRDWRAAAGEAPVSVTLTEL